MTSRARLSAQKIIADYEITSADDLQYLEELVWDLGASIQYQNLDGAEARLTTDGDKGVITINASEKYEARKRFSIGHEVGHFVLHRIDQATFNCTRKDMNEWFAQQTARLREVEANEFSIELLLPETLVKPIVNSEKPSFALIERLAEQFKMSLSATARRFAELSDEAVAMVFYSKQGVKWFKPSSSFEAQKYWIAKGPVDRETLAFDVLNGKSEDRMMSVSATGWIERLPEWLQEEVVQEQTRYFPNIETGISIVWIKGGKLLRY